LDNERNIRYRVKRSCKTSVRKGISEPIKEFKYEINYIILEPISRGEFLIVTASA